MRIVYISNLISETSSGGSVVSNANFSLLNKLPNVTSVKVIYIGANRFDSVFFSRIKTFLDSVLNYHGGLDARKLKMILSMEELIESDIVWVDSSILGRLVKGIKDKFPNKKIFTFFHNVEYDFFRSLAKRRSFFYQLVVKSCCYNELLTAKYADYIFALSDEDSERLFYLYRRAADLILPVNFKSVCADSESNVSHSSDLLFVGSDFPPNIEALEFLSTKVMPYTKRNLIVIGKGLEKYKIKFESNNIEIIGFVPDVSEFYKKTNIVLAPIFSGAGMKVKIAEALNFGKIVIGTEFSFVGYGNTFLNSSFMIVAGDSQKYIELLNCNYKSFSLEAKNYFEVNFSETAVELKLIDFFNSI